MPRYLLVIESIYSRRESLHLSDHCSPSERVKRLVAEQQRIQQELAELQQQAGDLSTDELAELKTLLAASEPSLPTSDRQTEGQQQLQKGTKMSRKKGKANMPPDVAKFLSGPGVLNAMDNTAAPREPQEKIEQSSSDKLKVLLLCHCLPVLQLLP